MIFMQISAAQGPEECELAVKYTLEHLFTDANKRRALELIALKLQQNKQEQRADQKQAQHLQHTQVQRGTPIRKF